MTELIGGCLCGSVRFKCKSGPIVSYACHCRFCQRSLGTVPWVGHLVARKYSPIDHGPVCHSSTA